MFPDILIFPLFNIVQTPKHIISVYKQHYFFIFSENQILYTSDNMHSNVAQILYLLLEFLLLTLNRHMAAARPEISIIEKVVVASRLCLYC